MSSMSTWDDFRLVKAIADTRTLAAAAEALGLNHSTVFRRLGALEESLGVRLFERGRAGYALTAAGEEMTTLAGRMYEDILDFERKVAGRDVKPSGELRVTTNDTMIMHLLTPIFADFCKTYPDIRLDLIVGNQTLNLARRDADVAIRATDKPPESLFGRRISAINWALYRPKSMDEKAAEEKTVPWVGFGANLSGLSAARWMHDNVNMQHVVYRVSTVLGLAEAVAAGIGCGCLPCFIGDANADIVRIGGTVPELHNELWILTHPDLRRAARVRVFMESVGSKLARYRKLLEGENGSG